MMKKKGFTLVELLAIIVLLSVILLISTPIVINLVEKGKEESRTKSILSYADAVRLSYTEENVTGDSLQELADTKMEGSIVDCDILKYDENYGTILHGCKVKEESNEQGKGDYCFISGNVYSDSNSFECKNIFSLATKEKAEYISPNIYVTSKTPDDTAYSQTKEIKIEFPSLKVIEEFYFINVDRSIELDGVINKCGTGAVPTDCVPTMDTILEANMWYQVSGDVSFQITKNMTVRAITGNNGVFSNETKYKEEKIDRTGPIVSNSNLSSVGNKVVVTANCSDEQSGISKYHFSVDGSEWIDNGTIRTYTFNELDENTSHTFKVKCTNGSGMSDEVSDSKNILKLISPVITQDESTRNQEWAQYRIINISYQTSDDKALFYYFKSSATAKIKNGIIKEKCDYTNGKMTSCTSVSTEVIAANTWYRVEENSFDITYDADANIVALISDATEYVGSQTYLVTNIDTTAPSLSIANIATYTDRAIITANCEDLESGIAKYEYSKDNGITWVTGGSSHTFSNLTQNTNYTYKIRCTNNSSISVEASSSKATSSITKPSISQYSQVPTDTNTYPTYASKRVIRITYIGTNVKSPEYYFKSTVTATVSSGVVAYSCGSGTTPSTCSSSSVTTLVANTWYKTNNTTVDIAYVTDGVLYAQTKDTYGNAADATSYSIVNIDTSTPVINISSVSVKTDSATVNASCSSLSGVNKIEYSINGTNYQTSDTFTGLSNETSYTFYVRCTSGSGVIATNSVTKQTNGIPAPTITQYSQTPSGTYAQNRVIRISYDDTDVSSPEYYFKSTVSATVASGKVTASCGTGTTPSTCSSSSVTTLVANTWYKTSSTTVDITFKTNGSLYAQTKDSSGNVAPASTYTIANIDATVPTVNITKIDVTTDRAVIIANCSDSQSGITKYEFSKDGGITYISNGTSSSYTFTDLTQSTSYSYVVRCTNGSGLTNTYSNTTSTLGIVVPIIEQYSQTPSGTYAQNRVIRITFDGTNITSPSYYFKSTVNATVSSGTVVYSCESGTTPSTCSSSNVTTLVANTWYKTNDTIVDITYTANGSLYAQTQDSSGNTASTSTYTIANIDITNPFTNITGIETYTDRAIITASCSDSESGITKYEFSKDNGTTWVDNGTTSSYTFTGLTQSTSYSYVVKCTNGSGLTDTASNVISTTGIVAPVITQLSQIPSNTDYAQQRVIGITFDGTNITSPEYYFKATGTTTIMSGNVIAVCGNGTSPSTCTESSVTTLSSGYWYKTNSSVVAITYTSVGSLYAITLDSADNSASATTYTVAKVDASAPTASISVGTVKTDRITVTASCSDSESGITKYEFSKDNGSTWVDNGTTGSYIFTGLTQETDYTFAIRCTNGSGLTDTITSSKSTSGIVSPTISQTNQIPSDTEFAQRRVITITYSSANISSPSYYFKTSSTATVASGVVTAACGYDTNPGDCTTSSVTTLIPGYWYKTGSTSVSVTYTSIGNLYAMTMDAADNSASATTYTVTSMDSTAPSVSISSIALKTDRATINTTCSDTGSGITKYEFSKDGGSTWVDNGTTSSYTFTGLKQSTSYTFALRCTNGSGMTNVVTSYKSTSSIVAPTISQTSQTPSDSEYATERVITITYSGTNIQSPEYYFKTASTATVASGKVTASCGTGTTPSTCSSSSVTTLVANTWYKTSSTLVDVTYTANGSLYAMTMDAADNSASATTYTIANIDTSTPTATISSVSVKTDRATITAVCDADSGITKYEYSKDNGTTWVTGTTNNYTFTGLTQGTEYTFALRCTNGSGVTGTSSKTTTTASITKPTVTQTSQTPSDSEYATERVITITYTGTNIQSPEYYFKTTVSATVASDKVTASCGTGTTPSTCSSSSVTTLVANTWYKTSSTSVAVTYTVNGSLYAMTMDAADNSASATTYTVTNMDTSAPSVSIGNVTLKTDRATITASCSDTVSGISKYEYSKDNGSTWVTGTTNSYTFTGLTQSTSYTFKIRCTNGSGLTNTASSAKTTSTITAPTIAQTSQTPSDSDYATKRVITITYSGTNIQSPEYYFKTTVSATVASGKVTASCGTGTTPSTCSSSSVTTLVANTWYKTSSTSVDVTYTSPGSLYAMTMDAADNSASATTYTVANIDTSIPSSSISIGSIKTDRATVTATCSDTGSGISKYEYSKDNGTTWVTGPTNSYTFTGLTQGTEYTFKVKCTNGSGLTAISSKTATTASVISPTISQTSQTPSDSDYATERIITITYDGTNIQSPEYYFKSTVSATVASGKVTASCGTGTTPSTCSSSSVTTLVANTWYKTSSTSVAVTYTSPGSLYAMTMDSANNSASATTYTVANMDTDAPSVSISSVSVKTDRATITAVCDATSGITKYEFSKDGGSTWIDNGTTLTYTFTGLTQATSYTFAIRCTNGSGVTGTSSKTVTTSTIIAPTIVQKSQTPSDSEYVQERVVTVTYSGTNIQSPEYYFKVGSYTTVDSGIVTATCGYDTNPGTCSSSSATYLVSGYWYKTTKTTFDITYTSNNVLYAMTMDSADNSASATTYTIANMDNSAPSVSIGNVVLKTDRATITASCSDSESGITKYEYSKDNGSTWVTGTTGSYTFTGLAQSTSYTFAVRCTNGSGLSNTASSAKTTSTITAPTITQTSQTPSDSEYATERVITITYSGTNIQSPEYYFKTTVSATVASGKVTASCGTGTTPSTCSSSSVTTLVANTWYKTSSTSVDVTYTSNGSLYAMTMDSADNSASATTYTVTNIDTSTPTATISSVSVKTDRATITASCTSTSGITKYEYSKDNGTTWVTGTTNSYTFTGLTQGTEYTFAVRCTNGVGTSVVATKNATTSNIVTPTVEQYSQVPVDTDTYPVYAQKRVISITYDGTNITSPEYYFKSPAASLTSGTIIASCGTGTTPSTCTETSLTSITSDTWYKVSSTSLMLTYTSTGSLYVMTMDSADNSASATTYTITNIDTSAPTASVSSITPKTDRVILVATCSDAQSGITKYEFSKDGGSTWVDNGTTSTYTFTGLTQTTSYTFALRCTNGAAKTTKTTVTSTTETIEVPKITENSFTSVNEWTERRIIDITFDGTNVQSPEYYIKSTQSVAIFEGSIAYSCGTGTTPSTCSSSSVTTLEANTWYRTTETFIELDYSVEATLYAMTMDSADNSTSATTYKVANIDTEWPDLSITSISTTTNSATVIVSCSDSGSGIYSINYSKDGGSTWTSNVTTPTYTFTGLSANTSYTFAARCTDAIGHISTVTKTAVTSSLSVPTVKQTSYTPTDTEYAQKRVFNVTYDTTATYNYIKVSDAVVSSIPGGMIMYICGTDTEPSDCTYSNVGTLESNTWYRLNNSYGSNRVYSFTFTGPATLYAVSEDASSGFTSISTYNVAKIDSTEPLLTGVSVSATTTNSISATFKCSDSESGITKYEFSKDGGSTWIDNGTTSTYTFAGLTQNTTYNISFRCTNGSGLNKTTAITTSTKSVTKPTITQYTQTPFLGLDYAESRTIKIVYTGTNVTNPEYYFKSTVSADIDVVSTASSSPIIASCGTGTTPSTCTSSNVTTLASNTWYKTNSTTIYLLYKATGTLYATTMDASNNKSDDSTYSVVNIDRVKPSVSISSVATTASKVYVTANCTVGNSGISEVEYLLTNDDTYIKGVSLNESYVFENLSGSTEYELDVICKNSMGVTGVTSTTVTTDAPSVNTTIAQASATILTGYTWATQRIIQITYDSDIGTTEYYFKSTANAELANVDTSNGSPIIGECGEGTEPGACIGSSTTSLDAFTWYKTTSPVINVLYTENGTLYATAYDGTTASASSTYTITKTSSGIPTAPTVTGGSSAWTSEPVTISISTASTEASGISHYQYHVSSSSSVAYMSNWTSLDSGITSFSVVSDSDGPKYVYVRAIGNNGVAGVVSSSHMVAYFDSTSPTVSVSLSGNTATITMNDNVAIGGYGINQSTTTEPTYTTINSGSTTTITYTFDSVGTYVVWVKDASGNITKTTFIIDDSAFDYAATVTTSTYTAKSGESCSSVCQITSVSNYGSCCTGDCSSLNSTDSNYHSGSCANGKTKYNSVCGYGVSVGEYYYYDCKPSYSCPNGGTLSGTTCIVTTYSCPNGGTLNSSTKMCEL